ncbi:conserved hypothetical protein [Prochlorococcus marinus str. NATL2A]|uniref:peptidylprolyl isomerase n=1 Tax=Prochlorococcus marinus (strain NATL2A) TaxID=59920 RepID=Q46IG5_PROMT|nr:peptidylprolyl isomerase [Prochlorococcus marinus]AAZ58713.1 conserved hypothetical protein [Prochlorococcus marinus str. NATL2A]
MESIKCLNDDTIQLLSKHKLLKTLVRSEIIKDELSKIYIDEKRKEELILEFKKQQNIIEDDKYKNFLNINHLNDYDVEDIALGKTRIYEYSLKNFGHKIESWFLERKSQLDIIVYSLIRVSDPFIARELYLRILSKETDIGDLATEFSEGIEKKTRGIVGPISIGNSHPSLANFLQNCEIGKVQPPLKINNSFLIIRVENFEPAKLDEDMKKNMGEELLNKWLDIQADDMIEKLIKNHSTKSNNSITS